MISRITKNHLCLGCGLCSSILGQEKCSMVLGEDGFYKPIISEPLNNRESILIKNTCPGIKEVANSSTDIWGSLRSIKRSWSSDSEIRYRAASGGVVTSLAVFLLEHKWVDAILQVGVNEDSYLCNELKVSRSREDVVRNAQSRYAPALVFDKLKEILNNTNDTFAFIGKPCDISAIKNFLGVFPEFKSRFRYFISIFCAGMPSYNATISAWKKSGHEDSPVELKYRGDGWPGEFKARFNDGTEYHLSYSQSWGEILGKNLCFRCKICPDGIGLLADISVGDSWNTKDGYPDFTDAEGKSFCMIRTEVGSNLFDAALSNGYIESENLNLDEIKNQQPYQYQRRKLTGWRVIPVQLFSGFLLQFKGLNLLKLSLSAKTMDGLKNMLGTFKRVYKIRKA